MQEQKSLIRVNRKRPNGRRKNIISNFSNNTGIQSLKYSNRSTYKIEKIHKFLWTATMIFVFAIWMKYCQNDTKTIVSENSKYGRKFPSVTFCPQRAMMEEKIDKIWKRMKLPAGVQASKLRYNIRHYYEFLDQTEIDNAAIFGMIDILKFNNMTMNHLINDLIDPCESFLRYCYYDEVEISCRRYFKRIMAASRHCCTFNSHFYFDEHTYRPKTKSVNYGPYSGLIVRFNENRFENTISDNNQVDGSVLSGNKIWVYVLDSYESLSDALVSDVIQPGIELHIQVEFLGKYVKKNLQNYCVDNDVEKRPYVPFYSVANCKLSAKIQKALHHCNCIPYFYAYGLLNHSNKICDIEEKICLNNYYNSIWRDTGDLKNYYDFLCPVTCKTVILRKTSTAIPINAGDFAYSRLYENITSRGAILRVYLDGKVSCIFKQEDEYYGRGWMTDDDDWLGMFFFDDSQFISWVWMRLKLICRKMCRDDRRRSVASSVENPITLAGDYLFLHSQP